MDDLVYLYIPNKNQLDYVEERAQDAQQEEYGRYNDIKQGQALHNYTYEVREFASDVAAFLNGRILFYKLAF